MSALLHIINHLIQQNPEQQNALSECSGRSVSINIAGFRIHASINEQGFLDSTQNATETEITFHNSAIQKILQSQQPGVGDISISGDLALGITLLPILGGLRYDANDDLRRLLGNNAANSISTRAAVIGQTVKQISQSIAEQIGEFAREPESPVIDQATLAAWMEEVDKLRDDVARLHARLDRLEHDIWL